MDGRADEQDDSDTQVFYRFGHESSLGDGPQDPRWDSTDAPAAEPDRFAETGETRLGPARAGSSWPEPSWSDPVPSEPDADEQARWEAIGRPPAPAAQQWDPATGQGSAYSGYRPSPFRRSGDAVTEEPGWSLPPQDDSWRGLAGHDDRPDWRQAADAETTWAGQASWTPQRREAEAGSGDVTTQFEPVRDLPRDLAARHVPVRLPGRRARRSAEGRDGGEDTQAATRRRAMPLWQELPLLLVVAFCLAVLIRTFLVQAFYIPSGSMENTLMVGDRVLVNKIVYDLRTPRRGEVIVFAGPANWAPENVTDPDPSLLTRVSTALGDLVGVSSAGKKDFIKRVIGLPGDRVSCCDPDGRVYVNGKGIDEPYVGNNSPLDVAPDPRVCRSRRFDEVLVPAGQLFVMGDHRIVSEDSRCRGTIPIDNVIGRAFAIAWPSSRWDTLSVPDTFASIPGPVAADLPAGQVAVPEPSGGGSGGLAGSAGVVALTVIPAVAASVVERTPTGRKRQWRRRTLRR